MVVGAFAAALFWAFMGAALGRAAPAALVIAVLGFFGALMLTATPAVLLGVSMGIASADADLSPQVAGFVAGAIVASAVGVPCALLAWAAAPRGRETIRDKIDHAGRVLAAREAGLEPPVTGLSAARMAEIDAEEAYRAHVRARLERGKAGDDTATS